MIKRGLRPIFTQEHITKYGDNIIELVKSCWRSNPTKRPDISKVVDVLQTEIEQGFTKNF